MGGPVGPSGLLMDLCVALLISIIPIDLTFSSIQDFAPDRVAERVEPLKKLLELRTQLADLRGSLQGNDKLDAILQATLKDADKMSQLKSELGPAGGNDV